MKKLFHVGMAAAVVLGLGAMSTDAQAAKPGTAEKPMKEISLKSGAKASLAGANTDYFLLHNDGEGIAPEMVENLVGSGLKVDKEQGQEKLPTLVAVGVEKIGGVTYTDFIFDETAPSMDSVRTKAKEFKGQHQDRSGAMGVQSMTIGTEAATHIDSYTWTFGDDYNGGITMGTYTSNVDYYRKGTVSVNGVTTSVWDVKYFNQSVPKNSYQTRQVVTRSSAEGFSSQTLRSYGPFTDSDGASVSVGLSGLVPNFAWTFNVGSSKVTDSSDIPAKYARWTFDVSLGSTTAKSTYVTQPGARFTNQIGNIGFKHSHTVNYYKNLSANDIGSTGVLTRYWTDL